MGENSFISWTHHTFGPWWGCVEVSPACDSCYARTLAHRWGFDVWGKDKPRRFFGEKHWNEPRKWNAKAAKQGQRARVFCASMADVFEDRRDLDPWRLKLWKLIEETPDLDWMLLTKRADCIERMLPEAWLAEPRHNVWLGVTAENQRRANERIPLLLRVSAAVHWVSAEPLLGPVDFRPWLGRERLSWCIVGGESGAEARRMDPVWARDIRLQCRTAGVSYHFKQKGRVLSAERACKDREGKDPAEWPQDLRVQEFPQIA
jgi:protein gp37